jgi:hypothetical protein
LDSLVLLLTFTFRPRTWPPPPCVLARSINGYQVQAADEVNEEFYGKHGKGNLVLINPGAVAVPEGKGVEALQRKLTELSPPAAEADK